jgi:hypothetical protein
MPIALNSTVKSPICARFSCPVAVEVKLTVAHPLRFSIRGVTVKGAGPKAGRMFGTSITLGS